MVFRSKIGLRRPPRPSTIVRLYFDIQIGSYTVTPHRAPQLHVAASHRALHTAGRRRSSRAAWPAGTDAPRVGVLCLHACVGVASRYADSPRHDDPCNAFVHAHVAICMSQADPICIAVAYWNFLKFVKYAYLSDQATSCRCVALSGCSAAAPWFSPWLHRYAPPLRRPFGP